MEIRTLFSKFLLFGKYLKVRSPLFLFVFRGLRVGFQVSSRDELFQVCAGTQLLRLSARKI